MRYQAISRPALAVRTRRKTKSLCLSTVLGQFRATPLSKNACEGLMIFLILFGSMIDLWLQALKVHDNTSPRMAGLCLPGEIVRPPSQARATSAAQVQIGSWPPLLCPLPLTTHAHAQQPEQSSMVLSSRHRCVTTSSVQMYDNPFSRSPSHRRMSPCTVGWSPWLRSLVGLPPLCTKTRSHAPHPPWAARYALGIALPMMHGCHTHMSHTPLFVISLTATVAAAILMSGFVVVIAYYGMYQDPLCCG